MSAIAATSTSNYANAHGAISASSGVALDHGFQTGLYVLTGLLILGALIAFSLVRSSTGPAARAERVEDEVLAYEEAA